MGRHSLLCSLVGSFALVGASGCEDQVTIETARALGASCAADPDGAADGITKTAVAAVGIWDPFTVLGPIRHGDYVSPGEVSCPGHEPTGDPLKPCPDGSRFHARNVVVEVEVTGTSGPTAMITGPVTIEANNNFDSNGNGHDSGTFDQQLDAGGQWIGTWTGTRSAVPEGCSIELDGSETCESWIERLKLVGCGVGGAVDGMHIALTAELVSFQPATLAFTSTYEGVITDPPN